MATKQIEYVAAELHVASRKVYFKSGATTENGIMDAAKAAIVATYHEDDNPLLQNGYEVMRVTPIGQYVPEPPESDEQTSE